MLIDSSVSYSGAQLCKVPKASLALYVSIQLQDMVSARTRNTKPAGYISQGSYFSLQPISLVKLIGISMHIVLQEDLNLGRHFLVDVLATKT